MIKIYSMLKKCSSMWKHLLKSTKNKKEIINNSKIINEFCANITEGEKQKGCVVLANGPGLKKSFSDKSVYEFIKNKKIFCVNNFPASEEFFDIKPDYTIFMDPFFWSKNLYESKKKSYDRIYENLEKVSWKLTIFISAHAKDWHIFIDLPLKNKNINIIYVNTNESAQKKRSVSAFKKYESNLAMPRVQNVTIASLFLAVNLGFEKIFLFGADHTTHLNVTVKDDNILYEAKEYFYNNDTKFIPCYKTPDASETFTMSEWLFAWYTVFSVYEELEEYSKYKKAKIFNSSIQSNIDAFERYKIGEEK